jgi:hypothetical protein
MLPIGPFYCTILDISLIPTTNYYLVEISAYEEVLTKLETSN